MKSSPGIEALQLASPLYGGRHIRKTPTVVLASLLSIIEAAATIAAPLLDGPGPAFDTGAGPSYYDELVIRDVNGDGQPDIVSTSNSQGLLSVLLNKGGLDFDAARVFPAGAGARGLAMGDLNEDGHSDAVLVSGSSTTLSLLMGDGDGHFRPRTTLTISENPAVVGIVDLNEDGHQDLVVGCNRILNPAGGVLSVRLANGAGGFNDPVEYPGGTPFAGLAVADLNGDGHADVVAIAGGRLLDCWPVSPGEIRVYLGAGDGKFSTTLVAARDPCYFFRGMVVSDLDMDGVQDVSVVLVQELGREFLEILPGLGDGHFGQPRLLPVPPQCGALSASDVDGDGRKDLAFIQFDGGSGPAQLLVFLNHPGGLWVPLPTRPIGRYSQRLVDADFDNDGNLDLAASDSYGKVLVLSGRGDGSFGTQRNHSLTATPPFSAPDCVRSADFNEDGHPDLAVTCFAADCVTILIGEANGIFGHDAAFDCGEEPSELACGDFNRDGHTDIVTVNSKSNNEALTVLLGRGDGTFTRSLDLPGAGTAARSVAVGDLNHDGVDDIVLNDLLTKIPRIARYLGRGDGTFGPIATFAAGYEGQSAKWVELEDMDNDGGLDVVVGSRWAVTILFGDDLGSFSDRVEIPFYPDVVPELVVGDLTGDGRPDIIARRDFCPLVLIQNDGFRKYSVQQEIPVWGEGLALADLNGDGRNDLVMGGASSNMVLVYPGTNEGRLGPPAAFQCGDVPRSLAVSDFNADGHPDVALANWGSNDVTTLLNTQSNAVGVTLLDLSVTEIAGGRRVEWRVSDDARGYAYALYRQWSDGDDRTSLGFAQSGRTEYLIFDTERPDMLADYWLLESSRLGNHRWYGPVSSSPTTVSASRRLLRISPNPFRSTTSLRFYLQVATIVQVSLFDVLGHPIRVLLNGQRDAGMVTVAWDGKTAEGIDAPPGIYLARVTAGGAKWFTKVVRTR